jgi:hypothetical protein
MRARGLLRLPQWMDLATLLSQRVLPLLEDSVSPWHVNTVDTGKLTYPIVQSITTDCVSFLGKSDVAVVHLVEIVRDPNVNANTHLFPKRSTVLPVRRRHKPKPIDRLYPTALQPLT